MARKSRFSSALTNYLFEEFTEPSKPSDGSVTHELSFMYTPEDGTEKEIMFKVNIRPIDDKKEFVNISFEYPDPDNIDSGDMKVAADKFKAVENKNDVIVKKCMYFLDKTYGVDSLEQLPANLTACQHEEVVGGIVSDAVRKVTDAIPSSASGIISKLFREIFNENRHLDAIDQKKEVDEEKKAAGLPSTILKYTMQGVLEDNDGDIQVKFPCEITIYPDEDKKFINLEAKLPDPSSSFELKPHELQRISNSKSAAEKQFWKIFDATYEQENDMKSLLEKYSVNPDSFSEELEESVDETAGEQSSNPNANSSHRMQITLKKVQADTGFDIHLQYVNASYDATEALADVNALVDDDDFLEIVPLEEEVSYSVVSDDESLDIDKMSDYDLDEYYRICKTVGYAAILDAAYQLFLDNQFMGYSAAGPMMNEIQNYVCNYGWRVQEIIDSVSKMMLAEQLGLEHPARRIRRFDDSVLQPDFIPVFWKDYCIKMMGDIQHLVDALRLYSCNFSEDIQQTMQNWIRSWCHEIDYVLFRGELDNPLQV